MWKMEADGQSVLAIYVLSDDISSKYTLSSYAVCFLWSSFLLKQKCIH